MELNELMKQYAKEARLAPEEDFPLPELGKSLGLLHTCLLEAELERDIGCSPPVVTAPPEALQPNHLSRFVVGFLPFNSISTLEETNEILFQVFSFLKWMEKRDLHHGWQQINFQNAIQRLTRDQERCLQLSHHLDAESGNTLDEPPPIQDTLSDIFKVSKVDKPFITLTGEHSGENPRLRLAEEILDLVRPGDHLDLVLGDTTERWVILEAGQVFPDLKDDTAIPA